MVDAGVAHHQTGISLLLFKGENLLVIIINSIQQRKIFLYILFFIKEYSHSRIGSSACMPMVAESG